ncbi:hypothetical protein EV191_107161 [Tamaricihabitans halophyticus]|uniref:Uncharacterized protein n=1 Tax=Tamaricihabitans halophyticus TaxID=1262583 RepID=A0A4R2QN70_9PSEU|nr:hypothetical protein EV191_107161 [Tamaricihabitans halophyticus]
MPTIVVLVVGLLALLAVLVRAISAYRRTSTVYTMVQGGFRRDLDRLRARGAALRVALARRTKRKNADATH